MKRFFLITICILGGIFSAQQVLALTISPPRMELSADPGQKIGEAIKLINETDQEITVYTSTANFTAKEGEEGVPQFLFPEEKEGDLADWIEIEKGPITLSPSEQKVIPFTINIPSPADPGGHFAGIFFGTQPPQPKAEDETAIGVSGKVGSLILLRVSGDVREEGELIEFSLKDGKKCYTHLPVDFVIGFENSGNVHLKPKGEVEIVNIFGRTSGIVEVNKGRMLGGKNVLPETVRHFEISWIKQEIEKPPQGFLEKLKAEKDNFAFGRYRANLVLDYGTKGQKAQATIVFWLFPWHLILVSTLATALLVFLIVLGIWKYNLWIVKRAMKRQSNKRINS